MTTDARGRTESPTLCAIAPGAAVALCAMSTAAGVERHGRRPPAASGGGE